MTIIEDFLPLTLGNSDVILGVQWIEKLGPVTTNWRTQLMQFKVDGRTTTLQGDHSLECSKVALKNMMKTLRNIKEGYLIQLNQVEKPDNNERRQIPEFMTELLHRHQDLFEMPKGLPPSRGREHAIRLQTGTNPVSVRPYRYPQS